MKIDTAKLRIKIGKYFEDVAQHIDNTEKNDNVAIRRFTALENQEAKTIDIIDNIEQLAKEYKHKVFIA